MNEKQKRFCEEYIKSNNATKAYKTAYGTSEDVARTNAHRLLQNANICSHIANIRQKVADISIEKIADKELEPILTEYEIQKFWVDLMTDTTKKDEVRLKASDYLAHSKGMYIDRNEITSNDIDVVKISFVDKSGKRTKPEQDPKLMGEYTPPSNIKD